MQSEDIQETFLAMYHVGLVQEKLNDYEGALQSYFKAYEYRPTRAEPLLKAATIYRKKGNYLLGYLLSKYALSIPYPTNDLCVEYKTYEYAILVEFANCTLLSGRFKEGLEACSQLLSNPTIPSEMKDRIHSNYEFAKKAVFGEKSCPRDPEESGLEQKLI